MWLFILVDKAHLEIIGVGLARSITEFLNMIFLFSVVKFGNYFEEL